MTDEQIPYTTKPRDPRFTLKAVKKFDAKNGFPPYPAGCFIIARNQTQYDELLENGHFTRGQKEFESKE